MSTIPLGSNIPGIYGRIDPNRDNLSTDEAEMLVARFVMLTERGASIPSDLQAFILAGLRRQLLDGSGGWANRGRGAPGKAGTPAAEWAKMRAWYYFHFHPDFADLPKTTADGGRADAVGRRLGQSDSTVKRYVREFAESGFTHISESEGIDAVMAQRRQELAEERNLEKARWFCVRYLGLSDGEEALAPTPDPVVEVEPPPVDIFSSWERQAERLRPAPAPSPAEDKAREIVSFWKGQK